MSFFDPITHGAKADGKVLDTKAIQAAIDEAHANGGGTVLFRSGKTYLSGSLVVKSNVWLHVEQGSLLQASPNWEDITERFPEGWQMLADSGKFLAAHRGTENIGITGNGIIDGAGKHYIIEDLGQIYKCPDTRPFLLFFVGVHGVTLRDVTFRDSALWTLRLTGCEDVLICGIRIRGDLKFPNCDGIDLDRCRRARVSDCDIICGDDGISLKSAKEFQDLGPCEDIVVSNCTIETRSSALVVGVDATSPIRNVTFTNCVVRNSHRGLSVNLGEDSLYENILFSNCIVETRVFSSQWWGRGEPIYVSASPWIDQSIGSASNIRFTNILCRSECGAFLSSDTLGWMSNIILDSVRLEISPWSGSTDPRDKGGEYDVRPSSNKARQVYRPEEGIAGFHLENLKGVKMRNCEVIWKGGAAWYKNAVWARGCEGLEVGVEVMGKAAEGKLKEIDVA